MQTVEKFLFLRTDTNAYGVVSSLSTAKRRVLPFFAVHRHVLVSASDRFAHTPPCTRESCIYSKSERAATRFSLTRSLHFISRTRLLDTSRRTFFFVRSPKANLRKNVRKDATNRKSVALCASYKVGFPPSHFLQLVVLLLLLFLSAVRPVVCFCALVESGEVRWNVATGIDYCVCEMVFCFIFVPIFHSGFVFWFVLFR